MDSLTVSIGATLAATVTLRDETGVAIANTYDGTEPLSLALWAGEDQAAASLPGSTVAWLSAAAGTVTLRLAQADTATLAEGAYRLRVRMTDGSDLVDCYEARLTVTAAPGTATAPAVYCSYREVQDVLAGWVGQLQDDSDLAGYLDARAEARREFDRLLQRHYRGDRTWRRQTTLDHLLDGTTTPYRSGKDSATLQGYLDDDGLILTTACGYAVRHWCAMYAAALVLDRLVGAGDRTPYQAQAARLRQRCNDLAASLCVEVDTNDDGVGDLTIDLSVIDCLRA